MEVVAFLLLTVVLVLLMGNERKAPQSLRATLPPPPAPPPAPSSFDAQGCWTTLLLIGLVLALFGVIFLGLIGG